MAKTDLEQLLIRVEVSQKTFEKQLKRMNGKVNRTAWGMQRRFDRMNRDISNSFKRTFVGIGAFISAREVKGFFDEWTRGNNLLKSTEAFLGRSLRSQSELVELARKSRSDLEGTVSLYAKIARASKGRIKDEKQIARVTETVQKALAVGGAATSERRAAILQLGQGLGAGALHGDELRSIRENAPVLAQFIAQEFNTDIAGLKKLGAEGKLTSEKVIAGILAGSAEVDRQFAQTTATIADGITAIRREFSRYLNEAQEGFSVSEKIAWALGQIAENIDTVVGGFVNLAAVMASAKLGTYVKGLWDASKAAAALGVSARAASLGLAALGGPIGLTTAAVALLALNWKTIENAVGNSELSEKVKEAAEQTKSLQDRYTNLQTQLENANKAGDENAITRLIALIKRLKEEIVETIGLQEKLLGDARKQSDSAILLSHGKTGYAQIERGAVTDDVRDLEAVVEKTKAIGKESEKNEAIEGEINKTYGEQLVAKEKIRTETGLQIAELDKVIAKEKERLKILSQISKQAAREQRQFDPAQANRHLEAQERLSKAEAEQARKRAKLKQVEQDLTKYYPQRMPPGSRTVFTPKKPEEDSVENSGKPKGPSLVDFERERNQEIEHRLDMIRMETDFMQRQVSLREQVAATYVAEKMRAFERQFRRKLDPERDADLLARYRASGEELGAAREAQTMAQMRQEWNEALVVSKNRLKEERVAMEEGAEAARTLVLYHERLGQLRNAGITVAPNSALDQEIKSGAAKQAEIDVQTLERAQYRLQDAANELGKSLRDTFGDALRGVENFEQGFIRALDSIAKKLIDNALLGLLGDFGFGDKKASGLFGAIGGLLGFKDGGVVKAYHSGGLVRGPGTGTSDSIPALLSNGEFVITKEAVDRIGVNTLNMLNNISRFANGGLVGPRGGGGRSAAPLGNTTHIDTPTINITIESGAGENDEELAQRTAKAVRDQMRNLVREEVIDMQRSGNPLGRER